MTDSGTIKHDLEDIGFVVIATSSTPDGDGGVYSVQFDVWERDGDGSEQACGMGDRFIWGHIKWDGCSNWQPPTDATVMPWHFCWVKQAENVGKLFRRMYEIAAKMMPNNDFEDELVVKGE